MPQSAYKPRAFAEGYCTMGPMPNTGMAIVLDAWIFQSTVNATLLDISSTPTARTLHIRHELPDSESPQDAFRQYVSTIIPKLAEYFGPVTHDLRLVVRRRGRPAKRPWPYD